MSVTPPEYTMFCFYVLRICAPTSSSPHTAVSILEFSERRAVYRPEHGYRSNASVSSRICAIRESQIFWATSTNYLTPLLWRLMRSGESKSQLIIYLIIHTGSLVIGMSTPRERSVALQLVVDREPQSSLSFSRLASSRLSEQKMSE